MTTQNEGEAACEWQTFTYPTPRDKFSDFGPQPGDDLFATQLEAPPDASSTLDIQQALAAINSPIRSEDNGDGTFTWHFSGEYYAHGVVPTLMIPRPWHVRLRAWLARRIYPEGCDE